MAPFAVSYELLGTFVPIAVYWLYSGLYIVLDALGTADRYRLYTKEEEEARNTASRRTVLNGVLLQQAVQAAVSLLIFTMQRMGDGSGTRPKKPPAPVILLQLVVAMFAMDTWQYFVHRYIHANRSLYRRVHAQHHALVVPYAFGALYGHPLEGLLMDTASGAVGLLAARMTPRTAIFFVSLANVKTVDDSCSLWLPGNPLHVLFRSNNTAFHGIHHRRYGNNRTSTTSRSPSSSSGTRSLAGTYMPYTLEKREGGGLQVRPDTHGLVAESKAD